MQVMWARDASGWLPEWLPARRQFLRQHRRLLSLRGRRIEAVWVAWVEEEDAWFPDLPIVLAFDDATQLEVDWKAHDDLSLTWNTIDIGVQPRAWVDSPLVWQAAGHPALQQNIGTTVRGLAAIDNWFETVNHGELRPRPAGEWVTGGLWFRTTGRGLHLFNADDETGSAPNPRKTQRTSASTRSCVLSHTRLSARLAPPHPCGATGSCGRAQRGVRHPLLPPGTSLSARSPTRTGQEHPAS